MSNADDPVEEGLRRLGVQVERREATQLEQMVGSGLGGIIGTGLAAAVGAGWLGKALASLGGSVIGHIAVTYRVTYQRVLRGDRPDGPMRWSDRR